MPIHDVFHQPQAYFETLSDQDIERLKYQAVILFLCINTIQKHRKLMEVSQ